MRRINSAGGMNRTHRLSQGAKKVTPPSIPNFNPRGSGSSFGSDYSYEKESFQRAQNAPSVNSQSQPAFTKLTFEADVIPRRGYSFSKDKGSSEEPPSQEQQQPRQQQHQQQPTGSDDPGIDMAVSPGRDSPGEESSASIATVESVSSGCRNSTTSLDSGRASTFNSAGSASSDSSSASSTFHTIQPILENRVMVQHHGPGPQYARPGGPTFRQSYHSSTSSLGAASSTTSASIETDSICALDIREMVSNGVPDSEIILAWLTDLHFAEYYDMFVSAGYDMPTIAKMTPEDLTAIGIQKPNHRKKLKADIVKLDIPDCLPNFIPASVDEWMRLLRLHEYSGELHRQGYRTIDDLVKISIEDLEDVGIYKLGHQKRLLLAIKRAKDLRSGRRIAQYPQPSKATQQQQPIVRTPNMQRMATFQHNKAKANVVYQPEVIRINGLHHHQQQLQQHPNAIVRPTSCSPSPPPPAPVSASVLNEAMAGMPQPMPPLPSFSRYQPLFSQHATALGDELRAPNWSTPASIRSFDDVDLEFGARDKRNYMTNGSALQASAGGGTLPRLGKACFKSRPVAKIVAKTREQPATMSSTSSLAEATSDQKRKISSFGSPVRRASQTSLKSIGEKAVSDSHSLNSCGENEAFPFANDNVGTIRMRSNSHVQQTMLANGDDNDVADDDDDEGVSSASSCGTSDAVHAKEDSPSQGPALPARKMSTASAGGGQRTAGDVLNDIGSMLADLTDELDAMLHMEREPKVATN